MLPFKRIKFVMANPRAVKQSKSVKRKTTTTRASAKKSSTTSRTSNRAATSRKKAPAKDPKGGLTAEGRKMFARKEGSHLRPGVTGPADTPEKMRRKGSFLRRHFAKPRGPMVRDGKPTRLALSAHAWGEPIPKTMEGARKLAAKGKKLLEQYQKSKQRTK